MKSSSLLAVISGSAACLIAMAVACTLNPQPLPPEAPDASAQLGADAGAFSNGKTADDAATIPTQGNDDGGGAGDVNGDSGDAASEGGSDASTDGSADATSD